MPSVKWLNQSQPQTLQSAVLLLYINGALSLIWLLLGAGGLFVLLSIIGIATGVGIAQEKRLAYYGAVAIAVIPAAFGLLNFLSIRFDAHFSNNMIGLILDILLVVLLIHPLSRSYARTWFK